MSCVRACGQPSCYVGAPGAVPADAGVRARAIVALGAAAAVSAYSYSGFVVVAAAVECDL